MTFERSVRELSQGLAAVLDEGPYAPPMTPAQAEATVGYRNYVAQRLRVTVAAALDLPPYVPQVTMAETITHPAHAMHEALGMLPTGDVAEPRAAVAGGHHRLMHAWEDTAVAAMMTSRTGDLDRLRSLGGNDAWAAVRDLTELVAVLPLADADLAEVVPATLPQRDWLLEPISHRVLEHTSAQVRGQLAEHLSGDYLRVVDGPSQVRPVRLTSPEQLPGGLRRLTQIVQSSEADLSRADLRAVLQVVSGGAGLAARLFREQAQNAGANAGGLEAVAADLATLPRVSRELYGAQFATLAPTDPRVRAMAQEVFTQLQALARTPGQSGRVQTWASEVTGLSTTVADGLGRALERNRLVTPTEHVGATTAAQSWQPVDDYTRRRVLGVVHDAAATGRHAPRDNDPQWVTAVAGFTAGAHRADPMVREACRPYARAGVANVNAASRALTSREMSSRATQATGRLTPGGLPRAAHPRARDRTAEGVPQMRRSG